MGMSLSDFLEKKIKIQGCYGFFKKNYLFSIGGIKKVGTTWGPYSDTRLAILSGLLDDVHLVKGPKIFYRLHEGSLSFSSNDINSFTDSQNLLLKEFEILFENKVNKWKLMK